MKFLLTSAGITNKTIAQALLDLAGKPAKELSVVFIPTASNVETGDKDWLIDDLVHLREQEFKMIDIVDISALPKDLWFPRFLAADILCFSGGNTFHLMDWIEKSGLRKELPGLLRTRVWMGISAGAIVTTKDLAVSQSKQLYHENMMLGQRTEGLGYFDFHFRPHLNSPYFPKVRKDRLEEMARDLSTTLYGLDDTMALKIDNGMIDIVGEGDVFIVEK
jgi:dipeptidase E